MNIGESIKQHRKSKGITQDKLAELLGVSVMSVRRWEWGERNPDICIMPKLANTLSTSVSELMCLQDNTKKESIDEDSELKEHITVGRRNDMYIIKEGNRELCMPDTPTGQEIFLKLACSMFNGTGLSEALANTKLNINNGTNSSYHDSVVNNGTPTVTQVEMSETA